MEINRAAFGALAVFGVVAASGGAYLANRPSEPVLVQSAAPAAGLVTETENSIGTTPAAIAESQAPAPVFEATPAPAAAPSRRAPAPVRTAPAAEGARTTARRPSQLPSPTYAPPSPSASTSPNTSIDATVSAAIEPVESTTVERAPVVATPRRMFDELTIPADSAIGLQVENAVSSDSAKVEQQVRARVTRDVRVRDQVAIPAGARAEGSITLVERGGRLKDQARLGIRFHTILTCRLSSDQSLLENGAGYRRSVVRSSFVFFLVSAKRRSR